MLINPPTKPLQLKKAVAGNAPMDESDAVAAKEALWRTSDYTPPFGKINPIPENELIGGIRGFQKRRGLREDGEMKPGGPTERLLRASLGQSPNRRLADGLRRQPISGSVGAAGRNTPDDKKNLKDMLTLTGQFDPDSPAEDEDFYLAAAIRNLQSEFGLPRTSTLAPGDEAETALRKSLALHADGDPRDPYNTPLADVPEQPRTQVAQAVTDTQGAFTEAGRTIKGMVNDLGDTMTGEDTVPVEGDETEEQEHEESEPDDLELPEGMEWRPEKGPHDSGLAVIRTDGPIKIEEVNPSIHIGGIGYTVIWVPLDEAGEPETNVQKVPKLEGGNLAPLQIRPEEFAPPFKHEHGWEVRINIRAAEANNDNTTGAFLNIHLARPTESN